MTGWLRKIERFRTLVIVRSGRRRARPTGARRSCRPPPHEDAPATANPSLRRRHPRCSLLDRYVHLRIRAEGVDNSSYRAPRGAKVSSASLSMSIELRVSSEHSGFDRGGDGLRIMGAHDQGERDAPRHEFASGRSDRAANIEDADVETRASRRGCDLVPRGIPFPPCACPSGTLPSYPTITFHLPGTTSQTNPSSSASHKPTITRPASPT